MNRETFFKDERLPFAEGRYSQDSRRLFKPHMHRRFSIGAVDAGDVIFRVADREICLRPGALALINPETLHCCNPTKASARSYGMLYLTTDWCLRVQQSLWQTEAFVPVADSLVKDEDLYRRFMDAMTCLMGATHLMAKEQSLADLAASLFRRCCRNIKAVTASPPPITHLKRRLAGDLAEDLTLTDLAGELGANPYTLLRRFKQVAGITPHAYRMNCRIEQARALLQEGMEISEVALACGFFDQSHFHRHFKTMTTVTPREYQLNFIQS